MVFNIKSPFYPVTLPLPWTLRLIDTINTCPFICLSIKHTHNRDGHSRVEIIHIYNCQHQYMFLGLNLFFNMVGTDFIYQTQCICFGAVWRTQLLPLNARKHKWYRNCQKKSRIRETPTPSTDADNRTDTNLKRLRDLSKKNRGCVIYLKKKKIK